MAVFQGHPSGNIAEVDNNNNLQVNLPVVKADAGYGVFLSEQHDGLSGYATPVRRTMRVSPDGRLRTGVDYLLGSDHFNHTVSDVSRYQMVTATATLAMTGGYLVFNAGNSVASGAVARVQTWITYPNQFAASVEVGFRVRFALNAQTNNVAELGVGFAATTVTPTDGVYFKLTTTGVLQGVLNINGVETTTSDLGISITAGDIYNLRIVIDQDEIEFYVDGVLRDMLPVPTSAASPSFSRQAPLLMRFYNSAATSGAQRMEVANWYVLGRDLTSGRSWETCMVGSGNGAFLNAPGAAAGSSANYANSAAPASATLSNTAAGYTTLGGQFQFAAVAGAETDYALFAYQVPAGAAAGANRNLVVRGLRIETFNMGAAVATTATLLQWGVGIGSTAVSLATADSATAGTCAPRRLALGAQSLPVATPIGGAASAIGINFDAPLIIPAGLFFHVILKMPVGTATASQIIRGVLMVNGYFE